MKKPRGRARRQAEEPEQEEMKEAEKEIKHEAQKKEHSKVLYPHPCMDLFSVVAHVVSVALDLILSTL